MKVKIKKLTNHSEYEIKYQTDGASGFDCHSCETKLLDPMQRHKVSLGFAIEIPPGYEGQVRSRSGLSLKKGLMVIPGTIDSDYRGEVCAIVINMSNERQIIAETDRIAQFVIAPVLQAGLEFVDELSETVRGENGFGSTGV